MKLDDHHVLGLVCHNPLYFDSTVHIGRLLQESGFGREDGDFDQHLEDNECKYMDQLSQVDRRVKRRESKMFNNAMRAAAAIAAPACNESRRPE